MRSGLGPIDTGIFSRPHHSVEQQLPRGDIPIIAYPQEVFLGQVVNREIYSVLGSRIALRTKAETSLRLATMQLALEGVGVGWVPASVAQDDLMRGT